MLLLTLVFLVVMVLPVVYPELSSGARETLAAIDLGIWAVFLAEYLARLFVTPNRRAFILRNPFDLLAGCEDTGSLREPITTRQPSRAERPREREHQSWAGQCNTPRKQPNTTSLRSPAARASRPTRPKPRPPHP